MGKGYHGEGIKRKGVTVGKVVTPLICRQFRGGAEAPETGRYLWKGGTLVRNTAILPDCGEKSCQISAHEGLDTQAHWVYNSGEQYRREKYESNGNQTAQEGEG